MKILIAEDDPVSRTVLAKIIATQPHHQISVAEDGAAAWAMLDDPSRCFDLAFIDLSMPKLDGFELLHRIRESPLLKSLQIVLCTAANDRATVVRAVQFGVRHYLVKPVNEPLVRAKLQQLEPVDPPYAERKLVGGF